MHCRPQLHYTRLLPTTSAVLANCQQQYFGMRVRHTASGGCLLLASIGKQLHLHQVERQGTTELAQFDAWFDCAAQIEASRRTSPEQARCC